MRGRLLPQDGSRAIRIDSGMNVIGRRSSVCDIRIASNRVSQVHCLVYQSHGEMWIQDLDSTNGTWVNGQRIDNDFLLRTGDKIQIGNHQFTFEMERSKKKAKIDLPVQNRGESELMGQLLDEMQFSKRFDFEKMAEIAEAESSDSDRWDSSVVFYDSAC